MKAIITMLAVALSLAAAGSVEARRFKDLKKDFHEGYNPEGQVLDEAFRTGVDLGGR